MMNSIHFRADSIDCDTLAQYLARIQTPFPCELCRTGGRKVLRTAQGGRRIKGWARSLKLKWENCSCLANKRHMGCQIRDKLHGVINTDHTVVINRADVELGHRRTPSEQIHWKIDATDNNRLDMKQVVTCLNPKTDMACGVQRGSRNASDVRVAVISELDTPHGKGKDVLVLHQIAFSSTVKKTVRQETSREAKQ